MKRKATAPLPTRTSGPSGSPGFLLWKVSNTWQRTQRAALQPFGLTHSQFVLLATATWFGADGPLTQARLAEISGVDPMTTSQIVRTLEAAGLVARAAHPDDPRAKAIAVTAAGRERASAAVIAVEQADAAFFQPLAARGAQSPTPRSPPAALPAGRRSRPSTAARTDAHAAASLPLASLVQAFHALLGGAAFPVDDRDARAGGDGDAHPGDRAGERAGERPAAPRARPRAPRARPRSRGERA